MEHRESTLLASLSRKLFLGKRLKPLSPAWSPCCSTVIFGTFLGGRGRWRFDPTSDLESYDMHPSDAPWPKRSAHNDPSRRARLRPPHKLTDPLNPYFSETSHRDAHNEPTNVGWRCGTDERQALRGSGRRAHCTAVGTAPTHCAARASVHDSHGRVDASTSTTWWRASRRF